MQSSELVCPSVCVPHAGGHAITRDCLSVCMCGCQQDCVEKLTQKGVKDKVIIGPVMAHLVCTYSRFPLHEVTWHEAFLPCQPIAVLPPQQ